MQKNFFAPQEDEPPTPKLRERLPLRFAMRDEEVAWQREVGRFRRLTYKELIGGGRNTEEELVELGWFGQTAETAQRELYNMYCRRGSG